MTGQVAGTAWPRAAEEQCRTAGAPDGRSRTRRARRAGARRCWPHDASRVVMPSDAERRAGASKRARCSSTAGSRARRPSRSACRPRRSRGCGCAATSGSVRERLSCRKPSRFIPVSIFRWHAGSRAVLRAATACSARAADGVEIVGVRWCVEDAVEIADAQRAEHQDRNRAPRPGGARCLLRCRRRPASPPPPLRARGRLRQRRGRRRSP